MMLYLLHLDPPLAHARHYLGFAEDVPARIERHLAGTGSPLIRAALANGSTITLAAVFEGDRTFERVLKRRKNTPRLCPICTPS